MFLCVREGGKDREGEREKERNTEREWKKESKRAQRLPVLPVLCSWWSQLAVGGGVAVAVGELGMQISLSALAAPPGAQMNYSDLV